VKTQRCLLFNLAKGTKNSSRNRRRSVLVDADGGLMLFRVSGVPVLLAPSWWLGSLLVIVLYAPLVERLLPGAGAGLSWLALALFLQGFPEQALRRSDEAVAAAPEIRHPSTTAQSLLCACVLSELVGRRQEVQAHAEVLVALYEPYAVMALPDGRIATGAQEIRVAYEQFVAGQPWSTQAISKRPFVGVILHSPRLASSTAR
jgi:hypothetical protein